jgi:hypothetical protein
VEITAAGLPPDAPRLYQRRKNGESLRYKGTPCSAADCWQLLDKNLNVHLNTREITATVEKRSDGTPGHALYERRDDGIWRYIERPCNGAVCPAWEQIDNAAGTVSIVSNQAALYQLRRDGSILVHNKKVCQDRVCPGWVLLDKNPRTRQIAAGVKSVYKLQDDGAIWRYPEPQHCSEVGCPARQLLYDPAIATIVSMQN